MNPFSRFGVSDLRRAVPHSLTFEDRTLAPGEVETLESSLAQIPFRPSGFNGQATEGLLIESYVYGKQEQMMGECPLAQLIVETHKRTAQGMRGPLELPSMPPGSRVTIRFRNVGAGAAHTRGLKLVGEGVA